MQSFSGFAVQSLFFALITQSDVKHSFCQEGFCFAPSILDTQPPYWKVTNPTLSSSRLARDHAQRLQEGPCSDNS